MSPRRTPWFGIAFTTGLSILLFVTTEDLAGLSNTTVLLLTSVFFLFTRRTGTVVAEEDLPTGSDG